MVKRPTPPEKAKDADPPLAPVEAPERGRQAAEGGLSLAQLRDAFAELLATPHAPGPEDDAESRPASPRTIVEAMLFVGRPGNRPLSPREMAAVIRGVSPQEIDAIVGELTAGYDRDGAAFRIATEGGGYRMVLRDDLHRVRDRFYGRVRAARLSQAAVDVLSVVAYNQPVDIDQINELRGKPSGAIVSQLVRRRLVRLERPPDRPRKPLYSTTERFLKLFQLDDLKDLPRAEDLDRS